MIHTRPKGHRSQFRSCPQCFAEKRAASLRKPPRTLADKQASMAHARSYHESNAVERMAARGVDEVVQAMARRQGDA